MNNLRIPFRLLFLLFPIALSLTGCSETETKQEVKSNPSHTEQIYKIISVHALYEEFINKTKIDVSEDVADLYRSTIIDPVYKDCFEDGEFIYVAESLLTIPPTNLEEVQEVIDQMDFEHISTLIEEALINSSNYLPSENETTVCIFPVAREDADALMFTPGPGKITVLYSQYYYRDDMIQAGIAHEYHHSLWTERTADVENHTPFTVLDNLIFEGKAVMFEKLLYPDSPFTSINPSYNKSFWNEIESDLNSIDSNRSQEILMGGKGGVPSFYGYSEGYKMVDHYLKLNPNLIPKEWYTIDAKTIYEEGNYIANYE